MHAFDLLILNFVKSIAIHTLNIDFVTFKVGRVGSSQCVKLTSISLELSDTFRILSFLDHVLYPLPEFHFVVLLLQMAALPLDFFLDFLVRIMISLLAPL